jgi:hypothetical protein
MDTESDAPGDLELDDDDAENVAGGQAAKMSTTPIKNPITGSQTQQPSHTSPDGLEQH